MKNKIYYLISRISLWLFNRTYNLSHKFNVISIYFGAKSKGNFEESLSSLIEVLKRKIN